VDLVLQVMNLFEVKVLDGCVCENQDYSFVVLSSTKLHDSGLLEKVTTWCSPLCSNLCL